MRGRAPHKGHTEASERAALLSCHTSLLYMLTQTHTPITRHTAWSVSCDTPVAAVCPYYTTEPKAMSWHEAHMQHPCTLLETTRWTDRCAKRRPTAAVPGGIIKVLPQKAARAHTAARPRTVVTSRLLGSLPSGLFCYRAWHSQCPTQNRFPTAPS